MADLDQFRAFDLQEATISLWIFKKSFREHNPVFTGRWVETNDALDTALKTAVASERARITELQDYGLLEQVSL